ncbi:MAG: 30S ribosomal protein S17e [Nanoarchaeota archaeon]|nr:30S ribosomal protein S17e [Nanoarchaeota archaeon]MBU4351529.1 30S ribosomal protein S17e [Nanoarchaeota archaeon]MCG2719780.1 30S ribosomal protein S17e [Nanoarchaeota archaeon]
MGRIKTTLIKRNTRKLMENHGDKIGKDFAANKKVVDKETKIYSKKLRNIMAGYATRLKKLQQ